MINIVKRPFTTNGEFYAVGTVIADPTAIRLYKSKVREGKIVEVNEHNLPKLTEWLESRTGIDFTESFEAALEEALKPKDEVPTPVVTKPEEPVVPTGGVIEGDLPILGDNGKGEVIIPLSEVTKLEVSAEVAKTLPSSVVTEKLTEKLVEAAAEILDAAKAVTPVTPPPYAPKK